jgi:hypothetical protein
VSGRAALASLASLLAAALAGGCQDYRVVEDGPGENLLPNAGFEVDLAGWITFYDSASDLARTTEQAHFGGASAVLSPAAKSYVGIDARNLVLAVDQPYLGTFWVSVPDAGPYSPGIQIENAEWRVEVDASLPARAWTRISIQFTPRSWLEGDSRLSYTLYRYDGEVFTPTEPVYFDDIGLYEENADAAP